MLTIIPEDSLKDLIEELETESKAAIDWFKKMIVNPDKFQAIIVFENNKMNNKYFLNIGETEVISDQSVTLLEIKTDNKLPFKNLISSLCRKASNQLNGINRIKRYVGSKEKEILINSFI